MPEQLALDHALRDRAAVDLDERPVAARAALVHRPCDELLAGTGLAREEHGGLHRRHLLHLPQDGPERRAFPDDAFEPPLLGYLLLEIGVLHLEPVAIPLDLPVELGVPDRERSLVREDAQERELLGRDPAVGEEANRSQLLAPEFERKSGCALDAHLAPGLQRARVDSEELELTPIVDQDGIAQAPLNRGGERGIERDPVRQALFGRVARARDAVEGSLGRGGPRVPAPLGPAHRTLVVGQGQEDPRVGGIGLLHQRRRDRLQHDLETLGGGDVAGDPAQHFEWRASRADRVVLGHRDSWLKRQRHLARLWNIAAGPGGTRSPPDAPGDCHAWSWVRQRGGGGRVVRWLPFPGCMTETVRTTRYPIDRRAQRIITAAFTEFSRRGVRAARMSVIARRAGVSPATLRQYFTTRDELFREVIRSTLVRLIQHPHVPGTAVTDQPIVGRIRHFIGQFWRTMEEPDQAALLRLSLGELSAFPELALFHTTEVIGRAVGRLEALLTEGVRRGEIRLCDDVRTVARVIVSALITYGVWLASPGAYGDLTGPNRKRAEEAAIDVLIGALGRTAA